MAQFPILRLTRAGQDLVGMSQGGGKLIFVRAELGDGQLGEMESVETLHALKHRVMQLPLQGYLNEGNGKARLRFVVDNSALTVGFFNREIGIVAKMEGGDEQLYAYTNAGNYADYIPSKDTPIDSEIIDLHILIGNASHVVIETQNGAYATKIEIEEHRTAAELDHPEKSVKRKHLADNVYTLPAPEATNAARFVGGDHKVRDITPGSIGAYSKGEVDGRVNAKVNKSGDTMTGTLNFVHNGSHITGRINDTDYYRITGIAASENNGYLEIAVADDSAEGIVVRQYGNIGGYYYGDFSKPAREAWLLNSDGNTSFPQAVTANTFYADDWFRARGNSGFYFQDHGGGWYMSDNDWIRVHENKNIYTGGKIKADSGFEGALHGRADSAGNSDTLGGQSLQWIIDRINEAKTGIVAGNLAENGWVKFANGLIVQWGAVNPPNRSVNFPVSFPSKIFQLLYTSELHFNEAPDGTWFRLKNKTVSGAEWLALTATGRFYIAIGI